MDGKDRAYRLRTRFGLSIESYSELLHSQGGVCAICGAAEPGKRTAYFQVDHDHRTGAVRGLLCASCNRGIGLLGDDVGRLLSAVKYLSRTP